MKTNAARVLDRLRIKYELRHYEVDPDDLSAEMVAEDNFPIAVDSYAIVRIGQVL